ncbi:MAG TPA: hypothetical protein DIV86_04375, partial [Alphaproteobacteria bacterium]|nr:hypothetical protein [Alphaproteobacteria bacterium]
MKNLKKLFIALFLFMAIGAKAAEFNPPSTTKSDIVGGKYVLDKSHANIFFSVSHLGFSNYFGK